MTLPHLSLKALAAVLCRYTGNSAHLFRYPWVSPSDWPPTGENRMRYVRSCRAVQALFYRSVVSVFGGEGWSANYARRYVRRTSGALYMQQALADSQAIFEDLSKMDIDKAEEQISGDSAFPEDNWITHAISAWVNYHSRDNLMWGMMETYPGSIADRANRLLREYRDEVPAILQESLFEPIPMRKSFDLIELTFMMANSDEVRGDPIR